MTVISKVKAWHTDPRPGAACAVIGEVAQSHDGSLGSAHAFIDAIADAGCDIVKFQTHIADAESTPAEPWRVKFSTQDDTRFDYWKRMEFTESQWQELKTHADARGMLFMSTPFSMQAVELLRRIGMTIWKIASGETGNSQMLKRIASFRQPVILSTGMSPWDEIDRSAAIVRGAGAPLAIVQCTSAYPCPPEAVGLNVMADIRERYGCATGLSDHSGKMYPGLAAVTLGCEVLEVHVALSRRMFGPDVVASLTVEETMALTEGVRFIEAMRAAPVDKAAMAQRSGNMRGLFTKSIVAARDLAAGTVLAEDDLALKKPGGGLPADRLEGFLGGKLVRPLARNEQLKDADIHR